MLYGAPFHARCLLYRLHDINCSVLVYHKPNVTAGPSKVTQGKFTTVSHFTSVCHAVTEVFVHHANSSTVAFSKLIDSPPIQLNLSDDGNAHCTFGEMAVMLEHFQLSAKEMFMTFPGRGRQFEEQISETSYWVKGPVAVASFGKELKEQTGSAEETKMHCWKLSVGDVSRKQYYDITESCNWSLTAMHIEKSWKVASAMYLEKRGK